MKRRTKLRLGIYGALITLSLLTLLFIRPHIVFGESMSPTLHTWDLCWMLVVRHYEPRRGDIVSFRTADDPPLYFIKRVVALPGETVSIERGVIKINGHPLADHYTTINPAWQMESTPVPAGKIFVLGDNREFEQADYVYGLVATRLVRSRLLWYWRWKK